MTDVLQYAQALFSEWAGVTLAVVVGGASVLLIVETVAGRVFRR